MLVGLREGVGALSGLLLLLFDFPQESARLKILLCMYENRFPQMDVLAQEMINCISPHCANQKWK